MRADEVRGEQRLGEAGVELLLRDGQLEVEEADDGLERRLRQPALRDHDLLPLGDVVSDQLGDGVALVAELAQGVADDLRSVGVWSGRLHEPRFSDPACETRTSS